jgi:hypothetical protein
MSQGDYIKRKKISNEANILFGTTFVNGKRSNIPINQRVKTVVVDGQTMTYQKPPIFSSNDYTSFKAYSLENTIINTKVNQAAQLPTPNTQTIFDQNVVTTNCPAIQFCTNTNSRINRLPLIDVYSNPKQPSKYIYAGYTDQTTNPTLYKVNIANYKNQTCKTSTPLNVIHTYPQFNKPRNYTVNQTSTLLCKCNNYQQHMRARICDICTSRNNSQPKSFAQSSSSIKTNSNLFQGNATTQPYKVPNGQYPKPVRGPVSNIWGFTLNKGR